jgi:hypothetical protein
MQESPVQHWTPAAHATDSGRQVGGVTHDPPMHVSPMQHSADDAQPAPAIRQGRPQRPSRQRVPRQQSSSEVHAAVSA